MSDNRERLRLLSSELFEFCSSNLLSEQGLREIIERGTSNHNDVSDYTFFLRACYNERVTEGIIHCLIEYFPGAINATNENGWTPLHFACYNKCVTLGIIQLLIDAAPASLRSVTNHGHMPLHSLCTSESMNEAALVEMTELLIMKCPESVRLVDNAGALPIHLAVKATKSPNFCRMLIEAYPGSERICDSNGLKPLHYACLHNTAATVELLYKLYPDAINHTNTDGVAAGIYPIHAAIGRNDPVVALEIVKFLLDCDPNVTMQKAQGLIPMLYFVCGNVHNDDSNIEAKLELIKAIYDVHPESIEDDEIVLSILRFQLQVQIFITSEFMYARQAKDHRRMMTPDDNGQLPLHRALQNNVGLGSIKLLVKGNPTALHYADNSGALPLHIACQHHDSTDVVRYLIGLDTTTLDAADMRGDTALHYACFGAKYETISMILETFDAVSVSRRNADNKLPIELLWESYFVSDRESVEYTESVFRLLRAYPEMQAFEY